MLKKSEKCDYKTHLAHRTVSLS